MATFHVKYPAGEMQINIGVFFGTQDAKKIKKLLRFASLHCSDEQREELITALGREDRRRKEALDSVAVLEMQRIEILSPFLEYSPKRALSVPEKELVRQRAKISKSIEILEEVWPL